MKKDFDYSELRKTRKNKRIGKKSDESEGAVLEGKKSKLEVKNQRKKKKSAVVVNPEDASKLCPESEDAAKRSIYRCSHCSAESEDTKVTYDSPDEFLEHVWLKHKKKR